MLLHTRKDREMKRYEYPIQLNLLCLHCSKRFLIEFEIPYKKDSVESSFAFHTVFCLCNAHKVDV